MAVFTCRISEIFCRYRDLDIKMRFSILLSFVNNVYDVQIDGHIVNRSLLPECLVDIKVTGFSLCIQQQQHPSLNYFNRNVGSQRHPMHTNRYYL